MSDQSPTPLRILVLEDDELDRIVIRRNLTKLFPGCQVQEHGMLEPVWASLAKQDFDCLLVDYRLPGGDGLNFLKGLREKGIDTPVIVVTSQGDQKIAVEVMKAGGQDYIQKDILNTEILGQVIRNALRSHALELERKSTAKKLEESQQRLYEAQRIANIGSWEIDLENNTYYWSDQTYRILGYAEPNNNHPDPNLMRWHVHPDDVERAQKALKDCIVDGQLIHFDLMLRTANGSKRFGEIHGRPIRNEAGWTLKVMGTLQDVTHRKETESALIAARDEAQRLAKTKEDFLANMSHEIRTPMNAIIGYTNLLHSTFLQTDQLEYLGAIEHAGQALIVVINDILDLSRIESGKMEFESKPFAWAELLQNLARMFAVKSKEKNVPIALHTDSTIPARIVGDATRLNQVLINLIGNALKFTESGKIDLYAHSLRQSEDKIRIRFEVKDTGIGIDPAKQASIFDSFTQASSETTRRFGGSGLGLTISKRIVELQGGSIGLISTPGVGSTFFFDLDFGLQSETASPPIPAMETHAETVSKPLRILVVDDIELNQKLAKSVLELAGHKTDLASTGKEAIEMISSGDYDLVLMDIQMPDMDGYTATQAIRSSSNPRIRQTPVVALTAHALPGQIAKILDAGVNEVISKPFHPKHLKEVVQKLCGGKSVDLSEVESLTGNNPEMLAELIEIFIREVPMLLEKIQTASQNNNISEIKRVLHMLKPSLLLFQVRDAKSLVSNLEDACQKEGHEVIHDAVSLISKAAMEAVDHLKVSVKPNLDQG